MKLENMTKKESTLNIKHFQEIRVIFDKNGRRKINMPMVAGRVVECKLVRNGTEFFCPKEASSLFVIHKQQYHQAKGRGTVFNMNLENHQHEYHKN